MNRKAFIIITSAVFIVLPFVSFAQATSTLPIPQKREEIKQYIEAKKLQKIEEINQKRLEIKNQIQNNETIAKLSIFAQDKLLKVLDVVFEKFDAVIVRYEGISTRLENRISKLEEQNIETNNSKELLQIAKNKITNSFILISATKDELKNAIEVKNEITLDQIKQSVELCKISLKESHSALVDVIVSLKETGSFEDFINE